MLAMSRRIVACTLFAVVAGIPLASAGPRQKKEAEKHVRLATQAFEAGHYDDALGELLVAYNLEPKTELLFAIGQAYSKLGRCDQATDYFMKFRAKVPKRDVPAVDQAIAACTPVAAAPPPPAPEAVATPPAPEPAPPPAPPPAPAPPAAMAASVAIPSAPAPAPAPAPLASYHWYGDKLDLALVATGLAGGVAGVVFYRSATGSLDDAEQSSTLARYNQLVDDAHARRTYAVAFGAGGAALVGIGVVRYFVQGRSSMSGVGLAPVPGGAVLTWNGGL